MNQLKTVFLLSLLTGILMMLGKVIGGNTGVLVMLGISLAINFVSYWSSDKIVLKMYNAREVEKDSRLYLLVAGLAKTADLPMPKVCIIPSDVPNAFATGRNPEHAAVAVTEGLLSMLDDDEVSGVVSHELSHVLHRDTLISTVVASIAGVISMIANMAQWFAIFGRGNNTDDDNNPLGLLLTAIIAPIAALIIQMSISRAREFMADDEGGRICDKPLALASALNRIEQYASQRVLPHASSSTAHMFIINPFSGVKGGLQNLFSTHPSTKERIARLQKLDQTLHGSKH
jgi:heat shock protein HtpX